MHYVVVDLEATCWENVRPKPPMETIEIGAVRLASASGPITDEFAEFIRPTLNPRLSEFCMSLTSIRQEEVDDAEEFWAVFSRFVAWCGLEEPFVLCSWGDYDLGQLRADCARHDLPFPATLERHLNLKREFARLHGVSPCGMQRALKLAGQKPEGVHHRGIDDARNIARLAVGVLPTIEREQGRSA